MPRRHRALQSQRHGPHQPRTRRQFHTGAFIHRAIYNRERHRIEMPLISKKAQSVRVLGRSFSFRPGETIHTESSYKYSLDRFNALARGSGWTPLESWTDADGMFSVHALVASE
jgi:uncharacterized SAM-dependent methyltransferase